MCVTAVSERLVDFSWQAEVAYKVLITYSMLILEHGIGQCDV